MSSTNFGSMLIFASYVVGTCNLLVGEFFLNGSGHILLLDLFLCVTHSYIACSFDRVKVAFYVRLGPGLFDQIFIYGRPVIYSEPWSAV